MSMETQEIAAAIKQTVEANKAELLELSHTIHEMPELSFEEYKTAALVEDFLEQHGFAVERGTYDMPTAFTATYGSGPFNAVICAEYDALPDVGHACGHNVIATMSLGAALALQPLADELGLTVTVQGTPAEEHGGGKAILIERGAWEDATISLMAHGAPGTYDIACENTSSRSVDRFDITYKGLAAHADAYPAKGVNTMSAATIALTAIGLLRQQMADDVHINSYISHGGSATNIIPDTTVVRIEVRSTANEELERCVDMAMRCFEAGAVATGCTWTKQRAEPRYEALHQDPALSQAWDAGLRGTGRVVDGTIEAGGGSTDMGNVSQVVPAIHPAIAILGSSASQHTYQFAKDAMTPAADQTCLDGAVALAQTVATAATGDNREHFLEQQRSRKPGSTKVPAGME
ncbi:MAG: amidohydrolase [Bifidobacterium tibiigranuli]|jgi:amidohydrolase|uniref:amidohydrolase n=1 Tax=Bifidobacterium tibiigranuli TaxID=2172043 RepID=UPI0026F094E8|nr:amidohydrolase [Bifidobacterium tibiigranuli]MCI1674183.1 amidohydrolase [Bifidobacterium tibiigranuli]MCI1712456.1 amidohydrolase [Bifidobacterium tibiigranuli]